MSILFDPNPYAYEALGNKNEITTVIFGNNGKYVDKPYHLEFPVVPRSVSCRAHKENDMNQGFTDMKVKLIGRKATVDTNMIRQQGYIYCDVVFGEELDSRGIVTLDSTGVEFKIKVVNEPLVLKPSVKVDNVFEISGFAAEALSKSEGLIAYLEFHKGILVPNATCELESNGKKSMIAIKDISYANLQVQFDLSKTRIAAFKSFSIKCEKDIVKITYRYKNQEPVDLFGIGGRTHVNANSDFDANSATSVGVAIVIVASVASIMSLLF